MTALDHNNSRIGQHYHVKEQLLDGSTWSAAAYGTALGSATPLADSGAGAAGTAANASHEDHVHPAGASGPLGVATLSGEVSTNNGYPQDTGLQLTVTVGSSGKVLIRVSLPFENITASSSTIGIREATTDLTGAVPTFTYVGKNLVVMSWLLTGQSAGAHTYKLSYGAASSTIAVINHGGGTNQVAVIEAWSVA